MQPEVIAILKEMSADTFWIIPWSLSLKGWTSREGESETHDLGDQWAPRGGGSSWDNATGKILSETFGSEKLC